MVVGDSLHRNIGLADVPKFHEVVMTRHQIILFVGVVMNISDVIFGARADFEGIFLANLIEGYVFVVLSVMNISLFKQ